MKIQAIGIYSMFNILLGGDLASTTLVKKEPVPVVEEYVMEQPEPSLPEPEPQPVSYNMQATFYTAFCSTGCIGITKSGHDVSNTIYVDGFRVVAVDTRLIPLGSLVLVELEDGQKFEALALDTGGRIKGEIIDILVSSTEEAIQLGRQQTKVTIIREGY